MNIQQHFSYHQKLLQEALAFEERNTLSSKQLFIKGDLSGIQEFIYDISSKGAAKFLKGRSIYLQLLPEVIAHYIFNELNSKFQFDAKFEKCLVYLGGGNFKLALSWQSVETVDTVLENCREGIDSILYKFHNGGVYFALAWEILEGKALLQQEALLNDAIGRSKNNRFLSLESELFEVFTPFEQKPRRNESNVSNAKFSFFNSFEQLTNDIVKSTNEPLFRKLEEKLAINTIELGNATWQEVFKCFGYEVLLNEGEKSLNNFNVEASRTRYMVNAIEVRDLGHVADLSFGTSLLGVLKMDVDNLGTQFYRKPNEAIQKLSKALSFFFEGYLNHLIDNYALKEARIFRDDEGLEVDYQEGSRTVYTVYSGGDDSFMIGSWNVLVELAKDIYKAFERFTDGKLTLSASLIFVNAKFPITALATIAEQGLHKAKLKAGKNSICLFDTVFSWRAYEYILALKKMLLDVIEKDSTKSKSVIRKIIQTIVPLSQMTDEAEKGNASFRSIYQLMYFLRELKVHREELANIYKEIVLDGMIRSKHFGHHSPNLPTNDVGVELLMAGCRLTELYVREPKNLKDG